MLEYFIKNRRGSITVMLSIILIAALSLNSSLIEMAKYRSMERLYKEMSENAAFSLLSYYDRDLYENFGFLALEHDVGEEELLRYLQMNLTGFGSELDLNRADILANVISDDVDVARLYPLSQKDVYVAQMMEFGAYRAPVFLANNMLNIEDTMNELIESLEKALPILNLFDQLSGIIEAYVETVICLQEYLDSAVKLKAQALEYPFKLASYDAAVSEMNDFIGGYEGEKDENYESQLWTLKEEAAENAAEFQKFLTEGLIPALDDYSEKMEAYITAYDNFLNTNAEALLATMDIGLEQEIDDAENAHKDTADLETAKNFVGKIKENMGEGQGLFADIRSSIEQASADKLEDAGKKLEEQVSKLSVPVEDLEQLDLVMELDIVEENTLSLLLDSIIGVADVLEKMVIGLAEAIKTIVEGVGALMLAFTVPQFDIDMNHTISNSNKVYLGPTVNPYEEEDRKAVEEMIEDSEEVAKVDNSMLEIAMQNLLDTEKEFLAACGNLNSNPLDPVGMLRSLKNLAVSVKNFITAVIEMIKAFIYLTAGDLMTMIYRKLYATVYATEMFSNRVTDLNSDTRLNGSSFFQESDYANPYSCFVQADAEYIYCGFNHEIANQSGVYDSMLMFRMLCNITSVLTDEELMAILADLAAIPIVGWIVAIVIILVKLILEAWVDMIQMIYAKGEVDILKLDGGYFSLDGSGIEDLKGMVEDVIKEQTGVKVNIKNKDSGKGEDKSMADEYAEGLLKWSYKDHLFVLMLLFTPRDKIYQNTATLIETQLQQKKLNDGADYFFTLDDMATYIRVDTVAEYQPLLPVPVIPGLNGTGIKLRAVHYSGY